MILSVLGLLVAIGIAAFFMWERNDMGRAMVEGDLKGRHATDIDIASDWLDSDSDTLSYDVTYTNASGKRVRNRAKVAVRPPADRKVFWQRPIG